MGENVLCKMMGVSEISEIPLILVNKRGKKAVDYVIELMLPMLVKNSGVEWDKSFEVNLCNALGIYLKEKPLERSKGYADLNNRVILVKDIGNNEVIRHELSHIILSTTDHDRRFKVVLKTLYLMGVRYNEVRSNIDFKRSL
ncbi:MAG: hypothetical protein DRP09_17270 [Candidatus Thorarchaeota archaeon]|nr:MAG: hypothetical protein DRP09_17270 [Candidatus Thorarchaeota archaeon]